MVGLPRPNYIWIQDMGLIQKILSIFYLNIKLWPQFYIYEVRNIIQMKKIFQDTILLNII